MSNGLNLPFEISLGRLDLSRSVPLCLQDQRRETFVRLKEMSPLGSGSKDRKVVGSSKTDSRNGSIVVTEGQFQSDLTTKDESKNKKKDRESLSDMKDRLSNNVNFHTKSPLYFVDLEYI